MGPAGPTTGFSHISGFAHNAVVVQTRTGHGSAFVTVTGGGACTGPGRPGNAAPVVGDSPWLSGTHDRYWDEDGLRTGGTIVKFYNRYAASTFPFVTVPLAAFGPAAQVRSVRSGPSDDPGIARRNPAQWFASWGLRHGCPHIPAVTSVRASAGSGQVRLSWPAGLGLRYLVYLKGPGQPGDSPVTTAYHDGATLTGLRPGSYVARVVPANLRKYQGRGAKVTFTVP